jgi:hypothetical protein
MAVNSNDTLPRWACTVLLLYRLIFNFLCSFFEQADRPRGSGEVSPHARIFSHSAKGIYMTVTTVKHVDRRIAV